MKVGRKYYKGYCSKMRLTKNQITLTKTVVNNDGISLDTLLAMGFNKSMVDCLIKKSALWMSRIDELVHSNPLRTKGYKLIDPSFIIKHKAIAA
jgi:hypothetical protein